MTGFHLDVAAGHRPFEVVAHLRSGVGFDPPYGLDLAGLLAGQVRARQQAALEAAGRLVVSPLPDTTEEDAEDLPLPLSRCLARPQWHWLASCVITDDGDDTQQPRTFYRNVNGGWAANAADRPLPYFHPSAGAYRDVMMPSPVVQCSSVRWRAVGDPDVTLALLRTLRFIGRRRATGEGAVLRWTVHAATPVDLGDWAHRDWDSLLRPCPPECADTLQVPYRLGLYATRPPSWHPDRLTELAMTDQEDQW